MSRYYDKDGDDYSPPRRRDSSRRRRDSSPARPPGGGGRNWSPDYQFSGGSSQGPPYPAASGAIPFPVAPPPGPVPVSAPSVSPQPRLQYVPPSPFYPPPPNAANNSLQVPGNRDRNRPRSQPPPSESSRGGRDRDRDRDGRRRREDYDSDRDSDSDERSRGDPMSKVKHAFKDNFSQSTSGLGVGVVGAILGGLAAREASEVAARRSGGHGSSEKEKRAELISTLVGAAVGGLGANAIEKRIEMSRRKTKDKQERWEDKWGKDRRDGARDRGFDLESGGSSPTSPRDRDIPRDAPSRNRDREIPRDRDRDVEGQGRPKKAGLAADYYNKHPEGGGNSDGDYVYEDRRQPQRPRSVDTRTRW
ncbi:hypothetical protein QBC46DRAFT_5908 [Diplogelasinospora grovesii]|uniref:Uncharacterized protein n=1 Tax=Diplogelasinospora grovesii TaxID=303347 RepID=A0AAN6NIJ3_9PEZI|nr:hypothetical protein QBC46DRAFT_5908 [Diplogelasinospora grovesii]